MKKETLILLSLASIMAISGVAQKKKKVKKTKAKVETVEKQDSESSVQPMAETVVDTMAVAADSVVVPEEPQDRIDTIYYNKNWRVTKNKAFASYYRLALYPADSTVTKEFKTYYISGELQGEGNFVELDKADDSKSRLCDLVTTYFKNGDIEEKKNYADGRLQGEHTVYYANKNIKYHVNMTRGEKDGLEASFTEDGRVCKLIPYKTGKADNFYVVVDAEGNYSKYSRDDDKPILETPSLKEIETEYKNGVAWPYYNKNGLIVGASNSMVDDIGDYREIGVFIVNKSMINVDIDPEQIEVYSMKGQKRKDYTLITADEYDEKIMKLKKKNAKRKIKRKAVVTNERENNVNANLGAQVFTAGTSNTLKEFQKRICDMKVLSDGNRMKYSEKMPEDLGYLERTTVHPGEVVSGYLYTSDRKAVDLFVKIKINGIDYLFEWKESKK